MFLLIDNYDSFTHNLWQGLQAASHVPVIVARNDALMVEGIDWAALTGIILSPGPGNAYNPADLGVCLPILQHCPPALPLLGICLGMQAMVVHQSNCPTMANPETGPLVRCPMVTHGKPSPIAVTEQPGRLFDGLSSLMEAMRYHSWAVPYPTNSEPDLRLGHYRVTAYTDCPDDAWVMAIAHETNPWVGVQFHPESIGTPLGQQLLANFVAFATHRADSGPSDKVATLVG